MGGPHPEPHGERPFGATMVQANGRNLPGYGFRLFLFNVQFQLFRI